MKQNPAPSHWIRSRAVGIAILLVAIATSFVVLAPPLKPLQYARGIVWQPTNDHPFLGHANWHRLGARELLVQFSKVDGLNWYVSEHAPSYGKARNWLELKSHPSAERIIVGLSGHYEEATARRDWRALISESERIVAQPPLPLTISDQFYFPVEVDPNWKDGPKMMAALNLLPRGTWISLYAPASVGDDEVLAFVEAHLPDDINLMFQDGVGVGARTAEQAAMLAHKLQKLVGKDRFILIAECFTSVAGHHGSATPWRIADQLHHYKGLPVFLFDGPHYLENWRVIAIEVWLRLFFE